MSINPNIDELLTGFIDGELSARQQIEVQRMVSHDPKVARRLLQLQNCTSLISSLPPAEAPAEILEQIKSALERKTLLSESPVSVKTGRGARHLMIRRVVAAAVMIGLFLGLAAVVYTIVAPVSPQGSPQLLVKHAPQPDTNVGSTRVGQPLLASSDFWCRLELKTDAFVAAGAFVSRAIEDNGLTDCAESTALSGRKIYSISCSKQALAPLLADLTGIWQKFNSATLFVETERFANPVAVSVVSPQQMVQILNQADLPKRVELARDFAVLNSISERAPGSEILAAAGATGPAATDLTSIPKPVLTWGRKPEKVPPPAEGEHKVNLTIVLLDSD